MASLIRNSNLKGMNRVGGRVLGLNESTSGLSSIVFLQHLFTVWGPKAAFSRSWAELGEISFLEIVEMGLLYFGIPFTAKNIFFPIANRMQKGIKSDDLMKSVAQLHKEGVSGEKLAKIRSVKGAAAFMAMVAGSSAIEYGLTFAKNLVTLKAFKRDQFSHIASLSTHQKTDTSSDNPVHQKSVLRIKQSLGVAVGAMGLGLLMAKFGHKSARLQKTLQWFLDPKRLNGDFKYGLDASKIPASVQQKMKQGMATPWRFMEVGMTKVMNRFFMAVAFVAYVDACRDKLERWEVIPRLAVVMPYLAFGSTIVEKLAKGPFMRRFPDLFKTNVNPNTGKSETRVSGLREIYNDAYAAAKKAAPQGDHAAWHAAAQTHFASRLPAKIQIFALPELAGVALVIALNSFLTRVWTPRVYQHFENKKAQKPAFVTNPAELTQPQVQPQAQLQVHPHATQHSGVTLPNHTTATPSTSPQSLPAQSATPSVSVHHFIAPQHTPDGHHARATTDATGLHQFTSPQAHQQLHRSWIVNFSQPTPPIPRPPSGRYLAEDGWATSLR